MFNPSTYLNSRPDGIGVLEVVAGLELREGEPRPFVPLKRTELRGEVTGPLAALHLTQVYSYSAEQCPKVLEAVYRFPLPGDAAVTGVAVRFGQVEIHSELKPRAQAEQEYEEAREAGKQAALVTRESPDVFTVQVAGLQPGQDVTVETSYVQLARAEGLGWSLRIPLTTSPRYVRSDELTSRHAHGQPLYLLRDPGHRFALDLSLPGAAAVESTTHRLQVTRVESSMTRRSCATVHGVRRRHEQGGLRVALQGGEVLPDRDCVLSWRPEQQPDRARLQLFLHRDAPAGRAYFLAQVAPPAQAPAAGLRREVILLVDHSGSMEGAKWEAADWAVKRFLSGLGEGDWFALGLFHSETRWFADAPRPADVASLAGAAQFLDAHRDSGGTELGVALEQALSLDRTRGDLVRHVLVITDAEVSDAGRILRLADQESARPDRRRISVLCVDAAPNSFLATSLAERGGGVARFLTSDPDEEDISTALDEVLADWSQPVLAGLRLGVDRPGLAAAGRQLLGSGEIDLGDLPAGRTVWVAGSVPAAEGDLSFRLSAAGMPDLAALSAGPAERPAVKALFGAWRVAGLEFLVRAGYGSQDLEENLRRLGYDPRLVLAPEAGRKHKVYAENARQDAEKALRRLLTEEALGYGLASSETAFVAVRQEPGQKVQATAIVGNALPAGWSEGFLRAPGGVAAAAPMLFGYTPPKRGAKRTGAPAPEAVLYSALVQPPHVPPVVQPPPVFLGVPSLQQGRATLFDSHRPAEAGTLPEDATLSHLWLRFVGPAPWPEQLDPGLALLIFVGDLSSPRARVRLVDLLRQGGTRPLNLRRAGAERVLVVLEDPAGAWATGAPEMEVRLG